MAGADVSYAAHSARTHEGVLPSLREYFACRYDEERVKRANPN